MSARLVSVYPIRVPHDPLVQALPLAGHENYAT